MTDYSKLVEALRCIGECHEGCPYRTSYGNCSAHSAKLEQDAAAAIEELLPKRGKWVEDTTTYAGPGLSNYKCSLCGKICGTWRRGLKPSELPNWCGNCGADMRKMEEQDGV